MPVAHLVQSGQWPCIFSSKGHEVFSADGAAAKRYRFRSCPSGVAAGGCHGARMLGSEKV